MISISVFTILALVASSKGSVGPSTNNSFCTESKECLEYELVCKTDEYEVRHYSPTRWVSTDAEAYFMGVGAAMAFRRLFQYITGANEGGVQMEMTAPVLVKIPEETKMWEPAVYTLNFPLPAAYQDKPPTPTNEKLYFTEMPEMDVYVRSYGGWMLSVTSRLHAHLLTKELERVCASYNHSYHYGVGYDSPLKLLNRHNEVWYISEGKVVCTDPQEPTPTHKPHPTPAGLKASSPSPSLPDTLSDSPSLPDTLSDSPALPDTLSDSPSLPETLSDSPALPDTLSDSPSVPDTLSDSPSLPDTLSDSPSLPDTLSDSASLPDTHSDSPSLSDSPPSSDSLSNSSSLLDTLFNASSAHTLSDSISLTPSNISFKTSLNSSESLSDAPSVPPSKSLVSLPSDLPAGVLSDQPTPAANITFDQTTNSSNPVSVNLLQADVDVWNTTSHTSMDTQAEENAEAESSDTH